MKKYITAFCLLVIALTIATVWTNRAAAFDPFRPKDPKATQTCAQKDADGNASPVCSANGATNPFTDPQTGIITRIANIFAFITGVAAVVLIIIGGFEYVRSGGDSAKVSKAKNTILFAIIGLIVVVVARTAVLFMVSAL